MDSGIGIGGLNTSSEEFVESKFDLFSKVEYENGIKKIVTQTFRPISTTTSKGPFSFIIPNDPEKFTNIESLRLHGKMRIGKKDGDKFANLTGENVSTVNNIFNSLWSSISTKLNGYEISDPSSQWYAYKSYFENHLSYSTSSKENILSFKGYFPDSVDKFDDVTPTSANAGFKKRKKMFERSQWVYFCINLHVDITTIRKYIPPGVKIEIDLERNNDKFCLLTDDTTNEFVIELEDLRLRLDRIIASPAVNRYYFENKKANVRLPIDRSMLKSYLVNANRSDLSEHNIIYGSQLPEQVIVAIVDEKAFRGDLKKNPYYFKHYDIVEASLVVNGEHEPGDLYKLDGGNKVDVYASFLENTGISTDDREFGITLNDYYGGSFLLVWDRTQDRCNRFHRHIPDSGAMSINIKSKKELTDTVRVIVYATYSKDLIFDQDNNVTTFI